MSFIRGSSSDSSMAKMSNGFWNAIIVMTIGFTAIIGYMWLGPLFR